MWWPGWTARYALDDFSCVLDIVFFVSVDDEFSRFQVRLKVPLSHLSHLPVFRSLYPFLILHRVIQAHT